MYKQTNFRLERPGRCLLPGLVSVVLVLLTMGVFMFYSRKSKMVLEMENVMTDARVATVDSQECADKLLAMEKENKKKDATIVDLNKDLEQKIKTVEELKKKEEDLAKEKNKLEIKVSEMKAKALEASKTQNNANNKNKDREQETDAKKSKIKTKGKNKKVKSEGPVKEMMENNDELNGSKNETTMNEDSNPEVNNTVLNKASELNDDVKISNNTTDDREGKEEKDFLSDEKESLTSNGEQLNNENYQLNSSENEDETETTVSKEDNDSLAEKNLPSKDEDDLIDTTDKLKKKP